MNVANDVEGTRLALAIVPEWLPLDDGRIGFFLRLEHMHVPEAFTSEAAQRSVELTPLVPNNVGTEVTIRS